MFACDYLHITRQFVIHYTYITCIMCLMEGEHCMQTHLYNHFTLLGHSGFLHDVSIALADKTDPSFPTKREDYWIDTLKTKEPM